MRAKVRLDLGNDGLHCIIQTLDIPVMSHYMSKVIIRVFCFLSDEMSEHLRVCVQKVRA